MRTARESGIFGAFLTLVFSLPAMASSLQQEVQALTLREARSCLLNRQLPLLHPAHPRLAQPGAVFVTTTKGGRTRTCWGSLEPQCRTLGEEIALNTRKALSQDYRFPPVDPRELNELSFYVSLVGRLEPVENWGELRPRQEGLWVTDGARGGVLLPGEAKTARWQVSECRRKAGIRPEAPIKMFRFKTTVFGPLEKKGKR